MDSHRCASANLICERLVEVCIYIYIHKVFLALNIHFSLTDGITILYYEKMLGVRV